MSCSKSRMLLFALFMWSQISSAGSNHRYMCPATLEANHKHYPFASIRVFDGPPSEMAELMGELTPTMLEFTFGGPSDVYMICGYKGTHKTITMHAKDASICRGLEAPQTAYCD